MNQLYGHGRFTIGVTLINPELPLVKVLSQSISVKVAILKVRLTSGFKMQTSLQAAYVNMGLLDHIHPALADRRLNFGSMRQRCRI